MKRILWVTLLSAMLVACAARPPTPSYDFDPGYDFMKVRTYAYVDRDHLRNISPTVSDMTRNRIEMAIDNSMTRYGYQKVAADQADMLVSYFVAVEEKQQVRTTPTFHGGYGHYGYRCHRCYYGGVSQTVDVRNYTEGTIVIDFIDRANDQGFWRSTVSSNIRKSDTQQERDARLQEATDIMIGGFPPL